MAVRVTVVILEEDWSGGRGAVIFHGKGLQQLPLACLTLPSPSPSPPGLPPCPPNQCPQRGDMRRAGKASGFVAGRTHPPGNHGQIFTMAPCRQQPGNGSPMEREKARGPQSDTKRAAASWTRGGRGQKQESPRVLCSKNLKTFSPELYCCNSLADYEIRRL